jgi:hypothetical protein
LSKEFIRLKDPSKGTPGMMSVNIKKKKELITQKKTAKIISEPKFELIESGMHDYARHFGQRKDIFCDTRPEKLIYKIHLPKVKNIKQVELDIEDDDQLMCKVTGI